MCIQSSCTIVYNLAVDRERRPLRCVNNVYFVAVTIIWTIRKNKLIDKSKFENAELMTKGRERAPVL